MRNSLVFTPKWIEQLRTRWDRQPAHNRPLVYYIATDPKFQKRRDTVERLVASLHGGTRHNLIHKLQHDNFVHTEQELVVAGFFLERGFLLQYERNIAAPGEPNLTPDWYVHALGELPPFIVEVATDSAEESLESVWKQLTDLIQRLSSIPVGVVLDVLHLDPRTLNQQRNKELTHRVRSWLMREQWTVGDVLESDNAPASASFLSPYEYLPGLEPSILISAHDPVRYSNVQPIVPGTAFMVADKPLSMKLDEKVSRYKDAVIRHGMPLVVAVFSALLTGRTAETFERVLVGTDSVPGTQHRLFAKRPELSAALWFEPDNDEDWSVSAILNPEAINPLAPSVLH